MTSPRIALAEPSTRRRRLSPLERAEERRFFGFLSPWIIGFLLFGGGPVLASLVISFTKWNLLTPPSWTGWANYERLVADPLFYKALVNTLYYAVGSVALGIVTCFLLAILLNQRVRGVGIFRTIFYLPSVVAGVATAILWVNILNPNYGLVNTVLGYVGIKGPGWLVDENWAIPGLILMTVWGSGNTIVIYLAGLQNVPVTLYEAATLDGAGWWRRFWSVTVPQMSPVIFFNLVTSLIAAFQSYALVLVMTKGGPNNATLMLGLYIYQQAFQSFDMGYASALSWALFLVIGAAIGVQFWLSRRWLHYE